MTTVGQTTIGQRLRALRLKKQWSQADVAKRLEISRATYVQYETGVNAPTRKLTELATLFGVTTDYLLGRNPNHKPYRHIPEGWDKTWLDENGNVDMDEIPEEILAKFKHASTNNDILRIACEGNPKATAALSRLTIRNGEVKIAGGNQFSENMVQSLLQSIVVALENAVTSADDENEIVTAKVK